MTAVVGRYLPIALGELGIRETPGPRSTPRIDSYLAATRGPVPPHADETPWCAAFVSWVLEQAGIHSTRSKAAISYYSWGVDIAVPRLGCIVVLTRSDPLNDRAAHVGFYIATIGDRVLILGGNQGNAVSIQAYPASRVMAYRVALTDL